MADWGRLSAPHPRVFAWLKLRTGGHPKRRRRTRSRRQSLEALEPRVVLAGDLMIAEIMADNQSTLQDEDGDASDWIEIYNRGSSAVDLEGWHLTDEADRLTEWEFPAVDLLPGHALVVFASGKDRDQAGRELHTNFKLNADGEYLALVAPDGTTVVDQFDPFPAQFTDVSYGPEQTLQLTPWVQPGSGSRLLLPTSAAMDVSAGRVDSARFRRFVLAEYAGGDWLRPGSGGWRLPAIDPYRQRIPVDGWPDRIGLLADRV